MQNKQIYNLGPYEKDNRLSTWNKWIKDRKHQTQKIAKKVKREPIDLVMSLTEKVREKKESKEVVESALIQRKAELRGGVWARPLRLKQRCSCEPEYEIQRKPEELGKPRVMEHVCVPRYIQTKEKCLTGTSTRNTCMELNCEYENYKRQREIDLKESILKIDPHRPNCKHLFVRGRRPITPPPLLPALPIISFTLDTEPPEPNLSAVHALRINNTVFFRETHGQTLTHLNEMRKESWHESCTAWSYYFKVPVNCVGRNKMYLENIGTVSLRYCWKKISRNLPMPDYEHEQVFFFNKNEDLLYPGQTREISFTFLTNKLGIHSEYWTIKTCNTCLFEDTCKDLIVNLYADAIEDIEGDNKKIEDLNDAIIMDSKLRMAKMILNDVVYKATVTEPVLYPYSHMFLERDLFLVKNPVCFYHQTEVEKMKDLYRQMVVNGEWDLSILAWRQAMMRKEFDERMRFYELLKQSHSELLNPWQEGEPILDQKHSAVKQLLGQLFDKFDVEVDRLIKVSGIERVPPTYMPRLSVLKEVDPIVSYTVRGLFYLSMREHVSNAMEMIAGTISSIDMYRWLDFEYCHL